MPFAMPVGTTSHPVLGDPLPDIFGASTSFMSSRPVQPAPSPVVNRPPSVVSSPSPVKSTSSQVQSSTPPPAASTPPASPRLVNGSPTLAESYTDEDDMSAADETASPEGVIMHYQAGCLHTCTALYSTRQCWTMLYHCTFTAHSVLLPFLSFAVAMHVCH